MTRAPRSSRRDRRSEDCEAARVIRTVLPVSAILGDLGKDFSRSQRKKLLTELEADFVRLFETSARLIGDDTGAVEACDESFDQKTISFESCLSGNRYLTAAAK